MAGKRKNAWANDRTSDVIKSNERLYAITQRLDSLGNIMAAPITDKGILMRSARYFEHSEYTLTGEKVRLPEFKRYESDDAGKMSDTRCYSSFLIMS